MLLAAVILAVALQQTHADPVPASIPVLGRTALWLDLVRRIAAPYGVPEALELGLIAHESHGQYTARHLNSNGTVDAGLAQINSGPAPGYPHWSEYGLGGNPDDPAGNVAASVRILSADVQRYGEVRPALLAYNAGTPANGLRFAPAYPTDVLAYAGRLEAGPEVTAWPSGGGWTAAGGEWRAQVSPSDAATYVVVSAVAPTGPRERYGGREWTGLRTADQVTVRAGGETRLAATSASAPPDLQEAMPPESSYWWTRVRTSPNGPLRVDVAAYWDRAISRAPSGSTTMRANTTLVLVTTKLG